MASAYLTFNLSFFYFFGLISSILSFFCSTLAVLLAFLLFFEHTKHLPTSGPLQLLFSQAGMLFNLIFSWLKSFGFFQVSCSNITLSEKAFLTALSKINLPLMLLIPLSCLIFFHSTCHHLTYFLYN